MLINKLTELVLFRFAAFKLCFLLGLVFLISACSPKLDWRTVQSPQEGYSALFPGKPERLDRKIPYAGEIIPQTLEALKIDEDIYSISTVHLTKSQASLATPLLEQLQNILFKRAGVDGATAISADAQYQTTNRQRLPTKDYFLSFKDAGASTQSMRVRWITRVSANGDTWIYQISVLHMAPSGKEAKQYFSEEPYTNFFDEFRL